MKIGFIGLPDSGKTTVFNALTRQNIPLEEYASIDKPKAHLGAVAIPDRRIEELASVFKPKKTTYAEIAFVDIAHPPIQREKGSMKRDFEPAQIRETDAFVHIVRTFEDPNVPHPKGDVNPARDIATVESEMIISDLEVAQNRIIKRIELDIQKREKGRRERICLFEEVGQGVGVRDAVAGSCDFRLRKKTYCRLPITEPEAHSRNFEYLRRRYSKAHPRKVEVA